METYNTERLSLPWYKIWIDALTRPSVPTYEGFLQDLHATSKRANIWLISSGIISAFSLVFAQPQQNGLSPIALATCSTPIFATAVVISTIVIAGIIHLLARVLGGTSTHAKLFYALATFSAPMTIISSLLAVIPYGPWLNVAVGGYWVVLSAIAVKAVYQFEWRKAIIAILPIILLTILLGVVTPLITRMSENLR